MTLEESNKLADWMGCLKESWKFSLHFVLLRNFMAEYGDFNRMGIKVDAKGVLCFFPVQFVPNSKSC